MSAQSQTDWAAATTDDVYWMFFWCTAAFAVGYGIGMQLRLAGDISRAGQ